MWARLKRIWKLGDYEVDPHPVYTTSRDGSIYSNQPVLKNVAAFPKGEATIIDMDAEALLEKDFPVQTEE